MRRIACLIVIRQGNRERVRRFRCDEPATVDRERQALGRFPKERRQLLGVWGLHHGRGAPPADRQSEQVQIDDRFTLMMINIADSRLRDVEPRR